MPLAEYLCEECDFTDEFCEEHGLDPGTRADVKFEVFIRGKMPALGSRRKCPVSASGKMMKRVISAPTIIVRDSSVSQWKHGDAITTRANGQEIKMTFVDHKGTDPNLHRNLERIAGKAGVGQGVPSAVGLGSARMDEKTGRLVVDVKSNVKDPLGALNKAQASGESVTKVTKNVNTPYKTRPKKG